MQSGDKIQVTFVFLMILQIIGLALVVTLLSNNAFAQNLNERTVYEALKKLSGLNEIAQIDVGRRPNAIAVNEHTNTIYVANSGSNSVSVINGSVNTKIGDIIVEGSPVNIAVDSLSNKVYVTEYVEREGRFGILYSDRLSVIDGSNNTKIGKDIFLGGDRPSIAVNELTNTVYVANRGSDGSVSVISGENNTKIGKDIAVGKLPNTIAVNELTNTVYVANFVSNGVSVIDGATNKVVAGIMLNVNPFNSGYIECDRLISPTAQYFYILAG